MVHTFACDKTLLKALQGEAPPSEAVRAIIRKIKPKICILCEGEVLHGNGWRSRSVLKTWHEWQALWYWRVECQCCGKTLCLMPEIVIPDLLYDAEVVAEVVLGRLTGKQAKDFAPHRRTQKRWLDRIRDAWSVAQSCGAIHGRLIEWCSSVSRLLEAIKCCAESHVGLFFPSRSDRAKTGDSPRRNYPAISTHQSCPLTVVALL